MTTPNPCGCCPAGLSRCWAPVTPLMCTLPPAVIALPTTALPNSAVVLANPLGFTFTGPLSNTFDGSIAGTNFWRINSGGVGPTQVDARWTFNADVARSYAFRIFHGGGGILNDGDGVASATLVVRDSALGVLFSGPIVSGNSGAGFVTDFSPPGPFGNLRHFDLEDIATFGGGAPNTHIREVQILQRWAADIVYTCPPFTMTGHAVATTDTQAGGITMPAGQLNQTNGPHDITWDIPASITGTITTDNPGNFSTMTIMDGTVLTVSGNQNNAFSVQWDVDDLDDAALPATGMICDGEVMWFTTEGDEIDTALLRDCPETS